MLKILIALLLLLGNGFTVSYDHIDGAPSGYYTIMKNDECIADDVQLCDLPAIVQEIEID